MKKKSSLLLLTVLLSGMLHAQEKVSMNVKDLNSDIEKYISKNYKDSKTTEAFQYNVVYEITIKKENTTENLVFDGDGKFMHKMAEADKQNFALQTRTTISLKDVEGNINSYLKKNFDGYKITEAYKYDEVYTATIVKDAESHTLLFDKDGKFEKIVTPAAPPAHAAQKTDSTAAKHEKKEEPMKSDTTKKN